MDDSESLGAIDPDLTLVDHTSLVSYAASKVVPDSTLVAPTLNAVEPSQDTVHLDESVPLQASNVPEHPLVTARDDHWALNGVPCDSVSQVGSAHSAYHVHVPTEHSYGVGLDPVDASTARDLPELFVPFNSLRPEPNDVHQSSDVSLNPTESLSVDSEGCLSSNHATVAATLPAHPAFSPPEVVPGSLPSVTPPSATVATAASAYPCVTAPALTTAATSEAVPGPTTAQPTRTTHPGMEPRTTRRTRATRPPTPPPQDAVPRVRSRTQSKRKRGLSGYDVFFIAFIATY